MLCIGALGSLITWLIGQVEKKIVKGRNHDA